MTRCSSPLFLVEVQLMSSPLYTSCRRSTLPLLKKWHYFAFIHLEKSSDHVPRRVLWWILRSLGVDEWSVHGIQGIYHNAQSCVRVIDQYSDEFGMGVGMHQGSVLRPLLFILVLEARSRKAQGMEGWHGNKGLIVNMKKTKFMVSGVDLDVPKKSGKYSCAICLQGCQQ